MNPSDITTMLRTLFSLEDVFEIRILGAVSPGSTWEHTESGYFDYEHIDTIPNLIANFKSYGGVYVTLNPVLPDLLARANNRFKSAHKNASTSDAEIVKRKWILIDVDAIRPSGISATEEEKYTTLELATEIVDGLTTFNFPEPIMVDSGNGAQLLYRIDLPAESDVVKQCLATLNSCPNKHAHVDTSVHNAARICRLPGTMNRKGDSTKERPHRIAEILEIPDTIDIVSEEAFAKLIPAEAQPQEEPPATPSNSPADDYNFRGDIAAVLLKAGWTLKSESEQQYWYRPYKVSGQHSATFNGQVFYVFSSNAHPFESNRGYNKFSVYTLLEHGGNFSEAAKCLRTLGYGCDVSPDVAPHVDLSGLVVSKDSDENKIEHGPTVGDVEDPGPLPTEMLRIPGFVSDVMDYCIENAPIRNPAMAFCGALALQSVLGARKVRDPADNRTNLYIIALAPTGGGKDYPRKLNQLALRQMTMANAYVTRFGSGEAIEDKLATTPTLLCQTDEIDGMLLQVKNSRDSRHESIMERLKEIFTSSDSVFVTRCLASKKSVVVDQPSLTIFGTAVPVHYYSALSEKMLTDGFFSRTLCIEANHDIVDQEPSIPMLPEHVREQIDWWSKFNSTLGDVNNNNPTPVTIPLTPEAEAIIADVRVLAREHQTEANRINDTIKAAIWSRVRQMTRKLALIYAISANAKEPVIDKAAMTWARDFVIHQANRMLFMARDYVSDNPFHAQCLKLVKRLREAENQELARRDLMRYMKCKASEFNDIVQSLFEQGRIEPIEIATRTKPAIGYRLVC